MRSNQPDNTAPRHAALYEPKQIEGPWNRRGRDYLSLRRVTFYQFRGKPPFESLTEQVALEAREKSRAPTPLPKSALLPIASELTATLQALAKKKARRSLPMPTKSCPTFARCRAARARRMVVRTRKPRWRVSRRKKRRHGDKARRRHARVSRYFRIVRTGESTSKKMALRAAGGLALHSAALRSALSACSVSSLSPSDGADRVVETQGSPPKVVVASNQRVCGAIFYAIAGHTGIPCKASRKKKQNYTPDQRRGKKSILSLPRRRRDGPSIPDHFDWARREGSFKILKRSKRPRRTRFPKLWLRRPAHSARFSVVNSADSKRPASRNFRPTNPGGAPTTMGKKGKAGKPSQRHSSTSRRMKPARRFPNANPRRVSRPRSLAGNSPPRRTTLPASPARPREFAPNRCPTTPLAHKFEAHTHQANSPSKLTGEPALGCAPVKTCTAPFV